MRPFTVPGVWNEIPPGLSSSATVGRNLSRALYTYRSAFHSPDVPDSSRRFRAGGCRDGYMESQETIPGAKPSTWEKLACHYFPEDAFLTFGSGGQAVAWCPA